MSTAPLWILLKHVLVWIHCLTIFICWKQETDRWRAGEVTLDTWGRNQWNAVNVTDGASSQPPVGSSGSFYFLGIVILLSGTGQPSSALLLHPQHLDDMGFIQDQLVWVAMCPHLLRFLSLWHTATHTHTHTHVRQCADRCFPTCASIDLPQSASFFFSEDRNWLRECDADVTAVI